MLKVKRIFVLLSLLIFLCSCNKNDEKIDKLIEQNEKLNQKLESIEREKEEKRNEIVNISLKDELLSNKPDKQYYKINEDTDGFVYKKMNRITEEKYVENEYLKYTVANFSIKKFKNPTNDGCVLYNQSSYFEATKHPIRINEEFLCIDILFCIENISEDKTTNIEPRTIKCVINDKEELEFDNYFNREFNTAHESFNRYTTRFRGYILKFVIHDTKLKDIRKVSFIMPTILDKNMEEIKSFKDKKIEFEIPELKEEFID